MMKRPEGEQKAAPETDGNGKAGKGILRSPEELRSPLLEKHRIGNRYFMDGRVRYGETDESLHLTVPAMMGYLQDCSAQHAEDLGVGFAYLQPMNLAWIMVSWQIEISALPVFGDPIRVMTWAYSFRDFFGDRNYTLTGSDGREYVRAHGLWILMDRVKMRPARVSPEMAAIYGCEDKLEMDYGSRKMKIPADLEERDPVRIGPEHIDANHHVNNRQYIALAQTLLPGGARIRKMQAEYRRQAVLGDTLFPGTGWEGDRMTVCFKDGSGGVFAVVAFEPG